VFGKSVVQSFNRYQLYTDTSAIFCRRDLVTPLLLVGLLTVCLRELKAYIG